MFRCFIAVLLLSGANGRQEPPLVPLRYDLQIQVPTASSADPLIPTFFAALRLDFQVTRPLFSRFRGYIETSNGSVLRSAVNERLPLGTELWLKARDLEGFENVTVGNAEQRQFGVIDVRLEDGYVVVVIAEPALVPGRYTLQIERYTGIITDDKGVFYRDVGNVAAIATNLFPDYADTVFPMLSNSLRKVSFRLSLLHPHNTVAISNMHQEQASFNAHDHWRLTDFVQAANLPPFMFAFAILPEVYVKLQSSSRYPISVYTNRLRLTKVVAGEVVAVAGAVYESVYQQLQEPLAFTHINIVFLPEFRGGQSTGLLFLSEDAWEEADDCHRIEMLAKGFIRQWMGGLATIESGRDLCFQEDVVQFLVVKIVNRIVKSAEKFAQYRLANYVRIQAAQVFFAPNRPLHFEQPPDESDVEIICGGRGAQLLESLETVFGADSILKKIRALIRDFAYRNFLLEDFLALLRFNVVDSVDLAQVYEFWFRTPGIANLRVEQLNERLRLTQMNSTTDPTSLIPIRVAIRNLSLPVTFMLSQGLDLAPLDSKLLPLTNLGYGHVYRVNYDSRLWERILRHLEDTPHLFSPLARAQLLNDFCYFGAYGEIGPEEDMLRKSFLQLMRSESEHFELCEFYAFWCVAARKHTKRHPKAGKSLSHLWTSFMSVLSNRKNYECAPMEGKNSAAVADFLCQQFFGTSCL